MDALIFLTALIIVVALVLSLYERGRRAGFDVGRDIGRHEILHEIVLQKRARGNTRASVTFKKGCVICDPESDGLS